MFVERDHATPSQWRMMPSTPATHASFGADDAMLLYVSPAFFHVVHALPL
jgi:hypothetical protein